MTAPHLSQLSGPLSWSLLAAWVMAVVFIVIVVMFGLSLTQRMGAIEEVTLTVRRELDRRAGVITEMQFLREEIGRVRAAHTEQVVLIEGLRTQVQANLLDIARLLKQVDWLQAQMHELHAPRRSDGGSHEPDVAPMPQGQGP